MLLYVDAGTGGIVLQALLSGAVGGVIFFKLAASRVVDAVRRRGRPAADPSIGEGGEESRSSLAR